MAFSALLRIWLLATWCNRLCSIIVILAVLMRASFAPVVATKLLACSRDPIGIRTRRVFTIYGAPNLAPRIVFFCDWQDSLRVG